MRASLDRAAVIILLALIVVFGFFPLANWIPEGHTVEWYPIVLSDWVTGTAIAIGGGLVLTILARTLPLWHDGAFQPILQRYERHPRRFILGVALLSGVLYTVIAQVVMSGRPLHIDEIIQVFQGRIFADGMLWRAAASSPEFFSSMHVLDTGGRVYGQFPPGGPAMLALGTLVGAEWLIGPLSGAVSVVAFGWLIRRLDPRPGVRLGGALLFGLAPFSVFMAGSHMNHVTSLMWIVVAVAALAAVVSGATARPGLALVSGLGYGLAATIRPGDAVAFAIPAGLWYVWRGVRLPGRWKDLVAAGIGVAVPVAVLLWVNANTTGHPLLFAYKVMWGDAQGLGFHAAPWGGVHTPARGLELVNLYFLRLQTYLFETPFPALLPSVIALWFTRRLSALDRYLLVGSLGVVALYFAYWHDGFYLGPRFMYPLLPVLVLWTARLPAILEERFGARGFYRGTVYAYAIAGVIGLAVAFPLRASAYAAGMSSARWDAQAAAVKAGVEDALVLVRESWGAQLMARMWALDITRSDAELLYRSIDRCRLDSGIAALEATGPRGPEAFAALVPLVVDSAQLVRAQFSADPSARVQPDWPYSLPCRRHVFEENEGFWVFPPLLLAEEDGNVYAKDLGPRNSLLLNAYPNRPVYLLRPGSTDLGATPTFWPVARDSMRQAWSRPEAP
jgi:hypothetical protein